MKEYLNVITALDFAEKARKDACKRILDASFYTVGSWGEGQKLIIKTIIENSNFPKGLSLDKLFKICDGYHDILFEHGKNRRGIKKILKHFEDIELIHSIKDKNNPRYFVYKDITENESFFSALKSYVGIEEKLS